MRHYTSGTSERAEGKLFSNIYFVEAGGVVVPQFSGPLILRLEFDCGVNVNSQVFNIWLDAACNLQRVDFSRLPFDIVVQIVTPSLGLPGMHRRVSQMERLSDASMETHMAYLAPWFRRLEKCKDNCHGIPKVTEITEDSCCVKEALCYHSASGTVNRPGMEAISFSLRKLDGTKQLMTSTMSRFRKDLKEWHRYSDDRVVLGDYHEWRPDDED